MNEILIVDSEHCILDSIESLLDGAGYNVKCVNDAKDALKVLDEENVSLVISEIDLNGISGLDLFSFIQENHDTVDVILTCSSPDVSVASDAIKRGVCDFICKPFHAFDILLSVKRVFEKRNLIHESKDFQGLLEKKIKEQTLSLRLRNQEKQQLLINMIKSLVQTLEAKDKYTEGHSRRVAENALHIAQSIGMNYKEQEKINLAGLLHDIGKIGVKESILNKAGRLTDKEYSHIKTHPLISQRILEPIPQFKEVVMIIRHHHEFFDGSGYPDGLAGELIPIGARILTVCDAYDAMTSDRPYRSALPLEKAYNILYRNKGTQFDPELMDVFFRIKGYDPPTGN